MTKLKLQQLDGLQLRIGEHQAVISQLELKQAELRTPPLIPIGASGSQIAEIFESVADRDDEIVGTEAALTELQRCTESLRAQQRRCQRELSMLREQESRDRLRQHVLSAIQT